MSELSLLRAAVWREIYSRRKAFLVSTTLILTLVVGGLVLGAWAIDEQGTATVVSVGVLPGISEELGPQIDRRLDPGVELVMVDVGSRADGEEQLRNGDLAALVAGPRSVLWGPTTSSRVVDVVSSAMRSVYLTEVGEQLGLDAADLSRLLSPIEGRSIEVEGRDESTMVVATMSVILMFVAMIAYGQWIAYGVVEEKANRVAELVLGALSPQQLLVAKMIALGGMGLTQLVVVGSVGVGVASAFAEIPLPPVAASTVLLLVGWFVLGFAFYGTLYAAAGSLAADTQEAGNTIGPLNILPGVGYALGIISFSAGSDIVARVLSFIPLWTPLLIPGRYAMGAIPWWEMVIAAGVMVVSTWLMVRVGARIYLGGITQATRSVGWRQAFRGGKDLGVGTRS